MINDGHGVLFWLLLLAVVIQISELVMLDHSALAEVRGFSFVRLVLLITLLIASFVCWMNRDMTLVGLDAVETGIISQYRAEQAVLEAQTKLDKIRKQNSYGKNNDQHR